MAITVNIKLTSVGSCVSVVDLYSDHDNYTTAFATGISATILTSIVGYNTGNVPVGATTVRIQNNNIQCNNFVDVPIVF
tara:strand:- start:12498 stop:12734 length:237 start_codon:yes stop_codon:yes gene_type:complete